MHILRTSYHNKKYTYAYHIIFLNHTHSNIHKIIICDFNIKYTHHGIDIHIFYLISHNNNTTHTHTFINLMQLQFPDDDLIVKLNNMLMNPLFLVCVLNFLISLKVLPSLYLVYQMNPFQYCYFFAAVHSSS